MKQFKNFFIFVGCLFIGLTLGYLIYYNETVIVPRHEEEQAKRIKACETPELVTQADGVKLYRINPRCWGKYVYFSRSGTSTTEQECTGSKARTCHENEVHVPNK